MYRVSLLFSSVLQPVRPITCRVSWLILVLVLLLVLPCFICSTMGLIKPLATKARLRRRESSELPFRMGTGHTRGPS